MKELKRIIVQGAKHKEALYHIRVSQNYGTPFIGSFEEALSGLPFFEKIPEDCDAALILEPHLQALLDVIAAGIPLIVADLTKLPLHDAMKVKKALKEGYIIEGIMKPGHYRLGAIPPALCKKGDTALLARSKSLLYDKTYEMTKKGLGQSYCLLLGEAPLDPFVSFFKKNPETKNITVIEG